MQQGGQPCAEALLSESPCCTACLGLPSCLIGLFVIVQSCNDYILDSQNESGFGAGGVNIYDIFADVCGAEQEVAEVRQFARVLGRTDAAHAQVETSIGNGGLAETASLAAAVLMPTPGEMFGDARAGSLFIMPIGLGSRGIAGQQWQPCGDRQLGSSPRPTRGGTCRAALTSSLSNLPGGLGPGRTAGCLGLLSKCSLQGYGAWLRCHGPVR